MAELKDDKLEWFPFYHNRFIRDTDQWGDTEVGVYLKLLCSQWRNGSLVDDVDRLRNITTQSTESFAVIWEFIKIKFTKGSDGKLRNDFLEQVRKKQDKLVKDKSQAGSEGARSRWNKFQKPTIEEVKAYCLEKKNSVNPETFYAHYESNGWKVGKVSMKDWKATINKWESRNKEGFKGTKPAASVYIKKETVTEQERAKTAESYKHQRPLEKPSKGGGGIGEMVREKMNSLAPKTEKPNE